MKEYVVLFVGMVVAIVLVGSVSIPILMQPVSDSTQTYTNSTTVAVNTAGSTQQTFQTSAPDTGTSGSMVVTFSKNGTVTINVTKASDGTFLGTLGSNATSPATFSLSQASMVDGVTKLNFTANNGGSNVTSSVLSYQQLPLSTTQGWNSAVQIFYKVILPLVLVAALIIIVMS